MAVDKRYQVFVSSTYKDQIAERRELMQALLELDCFPAGMELFPAADDDQWTLIKSVIDDCDYYVVVVKGRYGSTHPKTGISYTEMEYDYALETGKPIIGFIHSEPEKLPQDECEQDAEGRAKLDLFRAKVQGKPVKYWKSPAELGGVASRSLTQLIKNKPAVGWVRADQAVSASEITTRDQKIEDLEAKVHDLLARLPVQDLSLSPESTRLLEEAAKDKNGTITALQHASGLTISTNGIVFLDQGNGLNAAIWIEAIAELEGHGFLARRADGGFGYRVTLAGYEFVRKSGTDEIDKCIFDLPVDVLSYFHELSRPRNEGWISAAHFDGMTNSRETARYREFVEELVEVGALDLSYSKYNLTRLGFQIADRLWELVILRAIAEHAGGEEVFVESGAIARIAVLTDGKREADELQRYLANMASTGFVEAVLEGETITAAKLLVAGDSFLERYVEIKLTDTY
ncbi:DUF4062 domain-containing protein [Blastopirellula marina]|uniref:DUF4062 domain-containing protein n=1 Tax=Blastopirellula marina TaxID=124 RepID=A0A2S8GG77_9BACT|nr:DUF4062 domain-containing protein [Blastopirellula marina]PQO43472.1 hypothetical protein C5Y93_22725 [Blastopirellula marina]